MNDGAITAPETAPGLRSGAMRAWQTLMVTLSLLVGLASLYLWILHERSAQLTLASATREVEALLVGMDLQQLGANDMPSRTPNGSVIRIVADTEALDPVDRDALHRLSMSGATTLALPVPESNPTHLRYYARLGERRIAIVTHPLDAIARPINRHLARSYFLTGVLSFVFIGALVWVYYAAQREMVMQRADPATRAAWLERSLWAEMPGPRHNRLPWLLLATVPVFILDVRFSIMPLTGALYVAAVVFSLTSTHAWHTVAMAVWTLALSFLALFLSYEGGPLWPTLWPHALIVYFIIGAATFGLSMQRRIRNEALALTRASHAAAESAQMRAALTRAEAADARLRQVLERFTLATRYAGISVWEWDLVADMLYPVAGSDFGQRLGTATHVRASDYIRNFVYADDRDAMAEAFRKALADNREGAQIAHRYRCLFLDGSIQHIELRARVYFDKGKPARIVGVDWNVTREVEAEVELKRQTEQLRAAERRLERASLSSLEGHWETDLLSGQAWMSSSLRALLGFAPGEFEKLNITVPDLAHPEDKARNEAAYLEYLRNGTPYDVQLRLRNARGEYRWYRVQGAAERDAEQRPIRMSGTVQDIHRQKLAEDALRDAQARFERAVNGAQDGLFDYDLVNDTTWFSPRLKKMLGYEEHELNIKLSELTEYMHPDDIARINEAFVAHVKHRAPYDIENRLRKKNGEWLWVRARASAEFDRNGRAIRLSGSIQDSTESRAAREQLLRATAEAEAANAAKSAFLATMSHEIRTPMNGIIGMTELLLDTKLDPTQREYASIIRNSADSLLHVINDVLDFSKIEAGKLTIDFIDMDLRSLIEDVCALMALQAAAKNVELVLDIHPEVPEFVRGDAQRIRQCVLNLLSNAVKFTAHGEIVVEVCVLAQHAGKALTQFQVRDTGIGLQPEQLKSIFQPFVQADASTTRRFGGTGLGLSIVKKLVELMGGQVGVDSQPGVGSAFWFVLPLEPIESSGSFTRLPLVATQRRVLVVDDNETNRNVLAAQLTRAGFTVEVAADGATALQMLRAAAESNAAFDVALVDYQMPAMDGAMFGEIVAADSKLATVRLILLSSLDSVGDRSRFSGIGFAAYLTKPVRQRELIRCLQQVLACEAREWHLRSQPMVTRDLLLQHSHAQRFSGRVLVAEDNEVNRRVAQKYLERLGCTVRTVEDGAQCLAKMSEERFDLVLMDMQMPTLDGLEATRRIRATERGGQRTPIVALTANVLPGQVERCLEAGMDDFLGKPIDIDRLRDVLERFGLACDAGPEQPPMKQVNDCLSEDSQVIDWARVDAVADGDRGFANQLLETFLASAHATLMELRAAAANDDRAALARAAHKLKGASANIGAMRLHAVIDAMEMSAATSASQKIAADLVALADELNHIQDAIAARQTNVNT